MASYLNLEIRPGDYQEALECMSADIFLNQDNDKWTAKIGTNVGGDNIELFEHDNYKSYKTAEIGMEAACKKLKQKFNS